MPKAKLTTLHRSVILAAAALSAYHYVAEVAASTGREHNEDARVVAHDPELARLDVLAPVINERLRRHAIRDLGLSPRLRAAAERYLREQALPRVGFLDGREGGTLLIHAYGEDWRTIPAVRLAA
jgi:hypothetical protein